MKTSTLIKTFSNFLFALALFFTLNACIVKGASPENSMTKTIKVTKITEGGVKDIVFQDAGTDFYYINRGMEKGLHLDSLKTKILNKTVTIHLAELLGGATSEHISQLQLGDEIIYSEFDKN